MKTGTVVVPVYLDLVPCHGCGACAEIAPELFGMDPDVERPFLRAPEGPEDTVRQAMAYCPNDCITTED
jgi:ferredoxin